MDVVDEILAAWRLQRPDLDFGPAEVIARVWYVSRVQRAHVQSLAAAHGLDGSEFEVLLTLRQSGSPYELSAGALVRAAEVTSGAITNRVDRMAAKGLVHRTRDAADRRSVRVRLTDQGLELADTVIVELVAHQARMLAALPAERRAQVAQALRDLAGSFDAIPTAG